MVNFVYASILQSEASDHRKDAGLPVEAAPPKSGQSPAKSDRREVLEERCVEVLSWREFQRDDVRGRERLEQPKAAQKQAKSDRRCRRWSALRGELEREAVRGREKE